MKRIVIFIICCFCVMPAFAEDPIADDANTVTVSNELELQLSTLPEAKIGFARNYAIPFLQGESPLTEDNNISITLKTELSPVSLLGYAEAIWTPIAFFELNLGGMIGSGWNIKLFGSDIYGIGLNSADDNGNAAYSGSAFDGAFLKAQAGAALQADLAAVSPGDWNHVILRTYHEINGKNYTGATGKQSWYFEDDDGENINGFNYYGNLVLGYQMPIFLNMVALLAEADLYLYNMPNRSRWGDDLIRWTLSGILNFQITKQFSAALITQFVTVRNYDSQEDSKKQYYRNRELSNNNPRVWEFYRVAVIATYKL